MITFIITLDISLNKCIISDLQSVECDIDYTAVLETFVISFIKN